MVHMHVLKPEHKKKKIPEKIYRKYLQTYKKYLYIFIYKHHSGENGKTNMHKKPTKLVKMNGGRLGGSKHKPQSCEEASNLKEVHGERRSMAGLYYVYTAWVDGLGGAKVANSQNLAQKDGEGARKVCGRG